MDIVTVQEAQACLPELIQKMEPGEQVLIVENDKAVARLVCERPVVAARPGPGLCRDMVTIVSDDEDHLKDFAEYMP